MASVDKIGDKAHFPKVDRHALSVDKKTKQKVKKLLLERIIYHEITVSRLSNSIQQAYNCSTTAFSTTDSTFFSDLSTMKALVDTNPRIYTQIGMLWWPSYSLTPNPQPTSKKVDYGASTTLSISLALEPYRACYNKMAKELTKQYNCYKPITHLPQMGPHTFCADAWLSPILSMNQRLSL